MTHPLATPGKACPQCRKENRAQARYCGHCGRPFAEEGPGQPDSPGSGGPHASLQQPTTPLAGYWPAGSARNRSQRLPGPPQRRGRLTGTTAVVRALSVLLGLWAAWVSSGAETTPVVAPPYSTAAGEATTATAARQQLAAQGIPYTAEQFVREAEAGNTAVVEVFLVAGMNPNTTSTFADYSALAVAVQHGRAQTVEMLLAYGANPNVKLLLGGSLLTRAAERGDTAIVRSLLAHDARVNAKGSLGETAIRQAKRQGYPEIVMMLRQAGAIEEGSNAGSVAPSWRGSCLRPN